MASATGESVSSSLHKRISKVGSIGLLIITIVSSIVSNINWVGRAPAGGTFGHGVRDIQYLWYLVVK
jgi:hypothetical protein